MIVFSRDAPPFPELGRSSQRWRPLLCMSVTKLSSMPSRMHGDLRRYFPDRLGTSDGPMALFTAIVTCRLLLGRLLPRSWGGHDGSGSRPVETKEPERRNR